MLSSETMSPDFAIDEETHTIRLERHIDALPAQVFAAWTEPEQISQWWDATGAKLAACEIDLREGGEFRFTTSHHPGSPFTGIYREIAPPNLLEFDANGARGKVILDGRGGGTQMTVEITCRSAEHLAQFVAMGIAAGTGITMNNLVRYFAKP